MVIERSVIDVPDGQGNGRTLYIKLSPGVYETRFPNFFEGSGTSIIKGQDLGVEGKTHPKYDQEDWEKKK